MIVRALKHSTATGIACMREGVETERPVKCEGRHIDNDR